MLNAANTSMSATDLLSLYDHKLEQLQAEKDKLFFRVMNLPSYFRTPENMRYKQFVKLLGRITPTLKHIGTDTHCGGCGKPLRAGTVALRVDRGAVCNRDCHGLLLVKQYGNG